MSSPEPVVPVSEFDRLLADAFRTGLDLPPDEEVTALGFDQHPHWDSLGHISLIVALEESFGVELDEDDVLKIDSYPTAAALLKAKKPGLS